MKNSTKKALVSILFFLPFGIHTIVFAIYPAVNTFIMSIKENYSLLSKDYSGIGLDNYIKVFKDSAFIQSLGNTLVYASLVVPITIIISLIIAVLLNKKPKGYGFFQTIYFLPMVTATTAVAYSWRLIFNSQYGFANMTLSAFGLEPVQWLTNSRYSLFVLVLFGIWERIPFSILTILSALQAVNKQHYIAASIDGASRMLVFRKITFPAIAPNVLLLFILNTISAFRLFDPLFTLFAGKPGPAYNFYTMVYYMYDQMQKFSPGSYGKAAAAAMILFAELGSLTILVVLLRRIFKMELGKNEKQTIS